MDAKGRGSSIWGVLETSLEAILGPGLSVKRDMDAIYPGSKSRRPGSVCGSVCGVSWKVRVKKGAHSKNLPAEATGAMLRHPHIYLFRGATR